MKSDNVGPARSTDNSRTVAKNTAWGSVEVIFGIVANLFTSVAIVRVIAKDAIGQARLGDYQYIVFLTTITLAMGSFGLPSTARKYMAEYLNNGNPEVARATYLSTLKIQAYISILAAAVGFILISWLGEPQFFMASALLVAALIPRLIATIPSQANNAAEAIRRNAAPAVAGVAVTATVTLVGLYLGWDLVGLSAAVLAGASLECGLKLRSVELWLGRVPRGEVAPELRKRMLTYSGQGMALLMLNLVVWDRSDFFLLKYLNPDTKQILYFSVPFSLVDRVLMIPTLFGGALAVTMMAQYGRGESRLRDMTVDGGRYALLVALPMLTGLACVSRPLVLLVYGPHLQPMILTLAIMALFAIPKALILPPTMLLQSTERQGFLILWGCLCGVVDIGLDVLLVGRHGASGAAIANGSAQLLAALGTWIYVYKSDHLDLKLLDCGRIVVSGAIMAVGVLGITTVLPGYVGLALAIPAGAALWMIALRLTAALKPQDVGRFLAVGSQVPAAARPLWKSLIAWLAPSVPAA